MPSTSSTIKGQDVVVLLSLIGRERPSRRDLAAELDWDQAGVHRSLGRLEAARLYSMRRGPRLLEVEEFLVHGLKYLYPADPGALTRGFPTAWGAEPLLSALAPTDEPPPVWPHALGTTRGVTFEPLHAVVFSARSNEALARRLALVDALRAEPGPRVRTLAASLLHEDLGA